MSTLRMLHYFNYVMATIFVVFYFYQIGYLLLGLIRRRTKTPDTPHALHRYAAVISARNEENVIGGLIASLKAQDYPSELLDIYVIADNCTDNTAQVALAAGAKGYRRLNRDLIGKGYALDYLFKCLSASGKDVYDGYFVFDADNYVDPCFVREMNNTFDSGNYAALTSYRNSKNFGSSWISSAYATWFLREARYLNNARMILGTSCAVSGSGYLVSSKIIEGMHGWDFHTLTEDIQFSTFCAVHGVRIGYAPAEFYDEQPLTLSASWKQRMRWTKGFYQVFFTYGRHLLKAISKFRRFAAYDLLMTIAPGMLLTLISLLANGTFIIVGMMSHGFLATDAEIEMCVGSLLLTLGFMYITFFAMGLLTTITEFRHIHCPAKWRIVANLFTFPLFMFTYIPLTVAALFLKVDWVPTPHDVSVTLDEVIQGAR